MLHNFKNNIKLFYVTYKLDKKRVLEIEGTPNFLKLPLYPQDNLKMRFIIAASFHVPVLLNYLLIGLSFALMYIVVKH